ncbi:hypothetical protein SNEBB_003579 [Seison nebaliae]|nr:hypothetical protein SNEBB_003579 [Seison nebaliae]
MAFMLPQLFLGPEYVSDKDIIRTVYKPDFSSESVVGSKKLSPINCDKCIVHYPTLELIHFELDYVRSDIEYYKFDGTLTEYMESLKIRTFSERFKDEMWIKFQTEEIIMDHGFPKIVITTEQIERVHFFAAQTSGQTMEFVDQLLRSYNTDKTIKTFLKYEKYITVIPEAFVFAPYYPTLPENFWNKDQFVPMKLFKDFDTEDPFVDYTIYAFHLETSATIYDIVDKYSYPVALPKGTHEWNNRRNEEVFSRFNSTSLEKYTEEEKQRVISYLKRFVNRTIWQESLVNAGAFYYAQQKLKGKNVDHSIFIPYETIGGEGKSHSLAIIKSMVEWKWYLISDRNVHYIKNLKKFLLDKSDPVYFNFYIHGIFWHESVSYETNALSVHKMLKPVIATDAKAGIKRKLECSPNSEISTEKKSKN